jgi:HAD superfamily hydrolase (TIGR01509 family)
MLRALVFDFDGTILDTEMPWYRAWQEIYGQHGTELALHEWAKVVGSSDEAFDPVAHLEGLTGKAVERSSVEADVRERALALIGEERLRTGFIELIDAAHLRGLRVGLASSSPREWVAGHLERLGIRQHFEAVCTAADVEAVKPDPALYLLALARLRAPADETVAIEDSPNGLLAARAAGLACVVVPNDLTRSFAFTDPHLRVGSLAEVTLDLLDELVADKR